MKRIIDGKIYNTETAEQIAEETANENRNDFRWWEEGLYKTKKGNWFLCGEGGPMTRYASHYAGSSSYGNGLHPIDKDEARAWLERFGYNSEIETHFAGEIEDA